jgi:hypothetical protein
MIRRIKSYLDDRRDRQRICIALAKGTAMMQARRIDLRRPFTWEFSGFSQNGEDGIMDVLRSQLEESNRYFLEIGSSDGIQNNSSWLVVAEQFDGIMVEGDPRLVERINRVIVNYSIGVECQRMFVTAESAIELKRLSLFDDPDVFSLDIDGNDYYVARALFDGGFRPKIVAVEYNSVFGQERSVTIEYDKSFVYTQAHPSHLYYGVSLAGWQSFFEGYGYRFVTVERKGVNAFFVDPTVFDSVFLDNIEGLEFAENVLQLKKFRKPSDEQFTLIQGEKFVPIPG